MRDLDLRDLIIFKEFADNETIRRAVSLFSHYNKDDYIYIQREMVLSMDKASLNISYWQNYIVNLLAGCENIFSVSAEKGIDLEKTGIMELASLELSTLSSLFNFDFTELYNKRSEIQPHVATIQNIAVLFPRKIENDGKRSILAAALAEENSESAVRILYDYYRLNGCGLMENYCVFEWDGKPIGISNYDTVTFNDLIGYETEKQKLIENTEFLMDGKKAANTLLYGDSGTGKSSSVKALLERFKSRGLRLISIDKDHIDQLPEVLAFTGQRGCKFIIFIDDLSFEENEVEYKHFKSILEGDVKSEPDNTVIYVTSNRRNIIREIWSERETSDDVHLKDTLQEKKSLSDRFGLVVTYSSPTKDEYLNIVKGLAENNGIVVDDNLLAEALKWDVRRGGRSGRTARYFIDYYLSQKKE